MFLKMINKLQVLEQKKYKDYGVFLEENGKEYADKGRKLYKIRHKNDLNSGNGLWANRILW